MKYEYTYRNTGMDIWQLSMYYIYGSMVGMCNLIFTAAVLTLTIVRWETSGNFFRICAVLGCCLFPIIQPLAVYGKAKKQSSASQDIKIRFDDTGIHVGQGEGKQEISWNKIRRIAKKPSMILVFLNSTHGFVLPNRILKEEKNDFYAFLSSKMKK
ncbi:YcxB family protein [Lacrimispora sp.]|uniref:YcxB family protein n=1 Tax=Lacrimispora sp. TaxID=2719234 RepID=UPI0032E459EA